MASLIEPQPARREIDCALDAAFALRWNKLPRNMNDYERAVVAAYNEDSADRHMLLWQLAAAKEEDDRCRP